MKEPFAQWLEELKQETLPLSSDSASASLHAFTLTTDLAKRLSPADVEAFANALTARQAQLARRSGRHDLRIYWWHDEQAGQLRCSIAPNDNNPLLFGCPIRLCQTLTPIAEAWLNSPYVEGIPFRELKPCDATFAEPEPLTLDVWQTPLL